MKKVSILSVFVIGLSISTIAVTNTQFFNSPEKSDDTLTKVTIYDCYLKVFLEGPFNGSEMSTWIFDNGLLPVNQPYNVPPWNYNGTETLSVNPGADVVDWLLVEFRRTPYGPVSATPETMVYRCTALLMSDGTVTDVYGYSPLQIPINKENVYVIIKHRNHLSIMSNTPLLPWAPQGHGYDFTDQLSKAYLDGQKEIAPGVFGMTGGDCDANGIIENTDKDLCWTIESGNMGYLPGDWNLDLQVNNTDKDDIWVENTGVESMVPRAIECGDMLYDFRDDQTYNTVLIGDQCWMVENLNIGSRVDGSNGQINNGIVEKFCYNDIEDNCNEYGGLYQWDEIMQYTTTPATQGICPIGWHIPTDNEWKYLEGTVDSYYGVGDPEWDNEGFRGSDAGSNLKSETGWSNNGNGIDAFGFTALPSGHFLPPNEFSDIDDITTFWTSTEFKYLIGNGPIVRGLTYDMANVYLGFIDDLSNNNVGLSVRCLKYMDEGNQPPNPPESPTPENGSFNQPQNLILNWACSDPDSDPLMYDVFFGTEVDPPLLYAGLPVNDPDIYDLEENTMYYWKVRAHDDHGNMTEGPVWQFFTGWGCGAPFTDDRDGSVYNTTPIDEQCWMAENLNIGIMINGSVAQSNDEEIEKYCYDNLESNCDTYGGLYQWDEMMQYSTVPGIQGVCPDGWHIPTDDEWKTLEGVVDSQYPVGDPIWDTPEWRGFDVGKNIKSTSGWANNGNGTDLYGFNALSAGYRQWSGTFVYFTAESHFYTSNEANSYNALWRYLSWARDDINRHTNTKQWALSVRCVKSNEPPSPPENINPVNGATDQPVNINLMWSCSDPENDPLTFDIYFGADPSPPLIAEDTTTFEYNLYMLEYDNTYYWKILATDDHENSTSGQLWSFTTKTWECNDPFTDIQDGKSYSTTLIGEQCWMAENLNIGIYTESVNTGLTHSDVSNNGIIEKYCYDNNINNCDVLGGLYDWDEMMCYVVDTATQGICPDGWHIPTNFEWKILEGTVDSQFGVGDPVWDNEGFRGSDAGLNLKSDTGWSNNGNGTDAFGFTALPTGQRRNIGDFVGFDELTTFWTSSPYPSTSWSWRRYLQYDHNDISNGAYYRERGISVRCLKTNQPPEVPSNPLPADGAINQPVNTTLSWTCTDPENDPLTYDIYFGTETDPPLFDEGISNPYYDPGILNYGITYYWKIIAHDDHGNLTTGPIWNFTTEFTCGDPLFDLRDEQTYNTILIGDQCWMVENLNIGNFLPGSVMQSNNSEIEKYCYGNDLNTCLTYGGLYQWNERCNILQPEAHKAFAHQAGIYQQM